MCFVFMLNDYYASFFSILLNGFLFSQEGEEGEGINFGETDNSK